jgi:hypothetical protein
MFMRDERRMWFGSQVSASSPMAQAALGHPRRALTESDAVDIWIARWLRIRRKDILARYGCDPRRLYEVWEGVRFPASREQALAIFSVRYPELADRIDFGPHRRIPRRPPPDLQPDLFA